MKIENIECFLSLADTLNYTEAADRQNMTQSALSKIILQMENELGFPLFVRTHREVKLTPSGRAFAEESRKTLDRYYSSIMMARTATFGKTGQIEMVVRLDMIEPLAIDIIRSFRKMHPEISIKVISLRNSDTIHALDEGRAECAISTGASRNESVESIVINRYRDCLVVNEDHPFASKGIVSLEEAKSEPFVVVSRSFSSRGNDNVISKCRKAGFSPNIVGEGSSIPHLATLLASGPYVTMLSDNYKEYMYNGFVFIPLVEEYYTYCKFHWSTASDNPSLRMLADFVAQEFAEYNE